MNMIFIIYSIVVLDGFSATRRIRELESDGTVQGHLPIIALTANVSRDNEERCRGAGMDRFLPKPLKLAGESLSNCNLSPLGFEDC